MTQKYDFLFIKVVSAFGPGGGRTTFSIVMVRVQLIKKAKKSTFFLMDFKTILCMHSIVRVERRRFALHKVFDRRPPSMRKSRVIILNFPHCSSTSLRRSCSRSWYLTSLRRRNFLTSLSK